jgi:hypothetical protein
VHKGSTRCLIYLTVIITICCDLADYPVALRLLSDVSEVSLIDKLSLGAINITLIPVRVYF